MTEAENVRRFITRIRAIAFAPDGTSPMEVVCATRCLKQESEPYCCLPTRQKIWYPILIQATTLGVFLSPDEATRRRSSCAKRPTQLRPGRSGGQHPDLSRTAKQGSSQQLPQERSHSHGEDQQTECTRTVEYTAMKMEHSVRLAITPYATGECSDQPA